MKSVSSKIILGFTAVALAFLFSAGQAAPSTQPTTEPKSHAAPKLEPGQTAQSIETHVAGKTATMGYWLFLPADYGKDPKRKWPLMIFLHGAGERGSDLEMVKRNGPPSFVESQPDFPFIVVSPQCPEKQYWTGLIPALNTLLDHVLATTHCDSDKLYLTGLSMGGYGTWAWAQKQPAKFTAIVPVCGGGDPSKAKLLKNLPIWVFHGEADPTVPYDGDVKMVDALKKAGSTKVEFTHYPGVGHDCWTVTYANPDLYKWLLDQDRHPAKHHATTAPSTKPEE